MTIEQKTNSLPIIVISITLSKLTYHRYSKTSFRWTPTGLFKIAIWRRRPPYRGSYLVKIDQLVCRQIPAFQLYFLSHQSDVRKANEVIILLCTWINTVVYMNVVYPLLLYTEKKGYLGRQEYSLIVFGHGDHIRSLFYFHPVHRL